jgi:hypothetical protein
VIDLKVLQNETSRSIEMARRVNTTCEKYVGDQRSEREVTGVLRDK